MKYASTYITLEGVERVLVTLPLDMVPDFDPYNPPQPNTYCVPDDVEEGWERQPNGSFVPKTLSSSEILREKKRTRQTIVDAITVETSTGKIFDGNEDAQRRLNNAISAAAITGAASCTWVLANNIPTEVTLDEIKEAFALAFQTMGAVWAAPYE